MNKRIYLCLAHMSGKEQMYIKEAFDTNWVVPLGPNVNGFEKDLEEFVGEGKHVVALSAGTAAVHLALLACGVKPGDEVLVQSFTFCASSHPITYLGATPVFVDSEVDTWDMDPVLLEEAIKDRIEKTGKTPKAIVPVALYGMPYKVDGPSFKRCRDSRTPLTFAGFAPRLWESGTTDMKLSSIAPILVKMPFTITLKSGRREAKISISMIPSNDPIGWLETVTKAPSGR